MRYAITLPATDAEIAAQVSAVRAYWNKASSRKRLRRPGGQDVPGGGRAAAGQARRGAWRRAPGGKTQQAQRQSAAQAAITSLAGELRQRYGQLGVVTAGTLDGFAAKLSLTRADTVQAVKQAGLTLVEGGEPARSGADRRFRGAAEEHVGVRGAVPCRNSSIPAPGRSA